MLVQRRAPGRGPRTPSPAGRPPGRGCGRARTARRPRRGRRRRSARRRCRAGSRSRGRCRHARQHRFAPWRRRGTSTERRPATRPARKEGLDDFGPGPFEEPLGVLLDAYAGAGLNDLGAHIAARRRCVHSLRMRLRAQEWCRRHPEIVDEAIAAPIVVVGMMRSGTTLLQRLLAGDPRFALRLRLGGRRGRAAARPRLGPPSRPADRRGRRRARSRSRQFAPELFAIHPMYALEAEEEIVFLADAFLSHVPESRRATCRRTGRGSTPRTSRPAYRPPAPDAPAAPVAEAAARRGRRPLGAQDAGAPRLPRRPCAAGSPTLHVVHLHRDPVDDDPVGRQPQHDPARDALRRRRPHRGRRQWIERMGWTSDRALAARDRWTAAAAQVTDVAVRGRGRRPDRHRSARVYDAVGLELTADAERRDAGAGSPQDRKRETLPVAPLLGRGLRAHRRADPGAVRRRTRHASSTARGSRPMHRAPGRHRRAARARARRARADRAPDRAGGVPRTSPRPGSAGRRRPTRCARASTGRSRR